MTSRSPSSPSSANEAYYAQHAPFGAFASFTIGFPGRRGGFGHALRGPAAQNIYIGYKQSPRSKWRLLPFFEPPEWNAAAFTGEEGVTQPPSDYLLLGEKDYNRTLEWASDTWRSADSRFGFSLLSPFGEVPDPAKLKRDAARDFLSPHINGWIEYDNTKGTAPVELVFGVGESDRLFRPLQDNDPSLLGFAVNTDFGYATSPDTDAETRQGFDVFNPRFEDYRGLHVIGGETALIFTVPPGQSRRFPLALGFYDGGTISSGIDARYGYTRVFRDLEDVLRHGLARRERYEELAAQRDQELAASALNEHQKFLLAQATHSYFGSTQLLWDKKGPLWVVNEGEYRMMNTFDLTVDHLFFELKYFPWAVRDTLDLFSRRYCFKDEIKLPDGSTAKGGVSFTHDMGVLHNFTPAGHSSYECDGLRGCFSHMTMEQLLNWIIVACVYGLKTGDRKWLKSNARKLAACSISLRRRDHPKSRQRDGLLKCDSVRCGPNGSEITTYDSLDVSLGQARNNLYLAIKTLCAWILLEKTFDTLKSRRERRAAGKAIERLAATLPQKFDEESQTFPAVFEADNRSRIIPAIEGFVYPLYLGLNDAVDRQGRFGELLDLLAKHLKTILKPGVCIDRESGGWKMSSTSTNTWFSKIALSQHVARRLFPEALSREAEAADAVHAAWQRREGCGAYAMCDQIQSDSGIACGSRYYPRGVTAILWLDESW